MGQSIILIMFAIYCLSFLGAVATSHLGMLFMFIVHCSLFIVHCSLFVLLLLLRTLLLRNYLCTVPGWPGTKNPSRDASG